MASAASMFLAGERETGFDVRSQNVTAASAVANVVKTSLGPTGLDKMLVDDIGDVTITNDGATILKKLEVEHPAAKVLVELSDLQDQEVGDGTTSVVIMAAELLKNANELIRQKIHPTSIISGYRLAARKACKYIKDNLMLPVDKLSSDILVTIAKTSMSSKIIGLQEDFFAKLVVDAITAVKRTNENGQDRYPLKAINILKAHGKSSGESQLVDGFVLNCTRAAQGMPRIVKNAKIALLDFDLRRHRMRMGVEVVVDDVKELEAIQERELDITKERIQMILKTGANVIITTKGIDDMALKYLVEGGVIGVRRAKKEDLRRIERATGAKLVLSLANLEGGESFDASMLGHAESVVEERIADDDCLFIRGCQTTKSHSILLRGPNEHMLDEMERSVHDSLCAVKRALESRNVVAGGGSVEGALSIYLEEFATTLGTREQLAIASFAESLLIIPKTLAINAAKDATDLIASLKAYHAAAQSDPEQSDKKWYGLDLLEGTVKNNIDHGVLEPALVKVKCIQFAAEAAITILRIDDNIKQEKPEQGMDPSQLAQAQAMAQGGMM